MSYYKNMNKENINCDFVAIDYIDNTYETIIKENGDHIFLLKDRKKRPFGYIKQLRSIIEEQDYDAIHVHGNSSSMLLDLLATGKNSEIKKIVHGHSVETDHKVMDKLFKKKFLSAYDKGFSVSESAGKWLYENENYTILNNGIDTEEFNYSFEKREQYRREFEMEDKFVILNVGRLEENKNHAFLLDVFSEICKVQDNALLLFIGKGSQLESLKRKVDLLGLDNKVKFMGEQHETSPYYLAADVFVHPSKFESFGIVNLEAQCSGLKCVISDVIPQKVNVTNNVTFLSLNVDPEKWAEEILKYKDGYKREFKGDMISEKGYDIKKNAEELRAFYLTL